MATTNASLAAQLPAVKQALEGAVRELAAISPSARLDAEILLMHACGLTRADLVVREGNTLSASQASLLAGLVARRRAGEPIAYLTGKREFWSLDLLVMPATLIPRPETELLVERALEQVPMDAEWIVADLGTGSGAIALALAKERPKSRVVATDISADALAVARLNAERHGITIDCRLGDWFTPLAGETFDMLVCNPPYVAQGDAHLAALRYEPAGALTAGADGLDAIRVIARDAPARLKPGGWLLLEHGHDQGTAVAALLRQHGFGALRCYPDLAGHDRVTEGQRL